MLFNFTSWYKYRSTFSLIKRFALFSRIKYKFKIVFLSLWFPFHRYLGKMDTNVAPASNSNPKLPVFPSSRARGSFRRANLLQFLDLARRRRTATAHRRSHFWLQFESIFENWKRKTFCLVLEIKINTVFNWPLENSFAVFASINIYCKTAADLIKSLKNTSVKIRSNWECFWAASHYSQKQL